MDRNITHSISELESLGLSKVKINEFNNLDEMENLVDNLKQALIQDYKSTSLFTD